MNQVALTSHKSSRLHPHKFALWASFASIIMMFIALTSAYIVRQAAGNWLDFQIPGIFITSTIVIVASSISLHFALKSFKEQKESRYKVLLILTLLLGITFVCIQYIGWQKLFYTGVDLKGNPSGSFFYLITGFHAMHVLGGIAALIVALMHAFGLKFRVTKRRIIRLELTTHYWHFVDILWVYLIVFLTIMR